MSAVSTIVFPNFLLLTLKQVRTCLLIHNMAKTIMGVDLIFFVKKYITVAFCNFQFLLFHKLGIVFLQGENQPTL